MVVELERADQLGIPYVVVHPGAHTTASEEEGIALVAASIDEIHRRAPAAKAQITLELTAGQGTCLGCRLEQLAAIIGQVKRDAERARLRRYVPRRSPRGTTFATARRISRFGGSSTSCSASRG